METGARLTINAGMRLDWIKARTRSSISRPLNDLAVGPRIGANYSLTADSKNLLRASYGRVGDVPNASYIGSAGTAGRRHPRRVRQRSRRHVRDGISDAGECRASRRTAASIPTGDGRGWTRCWSATVGSFLAS